MRQLKMIWVLLTVIIVSGCANRPPAQDYSAFRQADPHSILVLPPINNTTEVAAPYSVMAQVIRPIAEAGFYVFPVAVVDETFKKNGLTVADDAQAVPIKKLRDIFGADAALYITISEYGTSYVVISSETRVTLSAKLVDLRNGAVLWQNQASASSAETRNNNGGGLLGALVEAAVSQIVETISDEGFDITGLTTNRLLSSGTYNGLLYGPRSPKYGQPAANEKSQ